MPDSQIVNEHKKKKKTRFQKGDKKKDMFYNMTPSKRNKYRNTRHYIYFIHPVSLYLFSFVSMIFYCSRLLVSLPSRESSLK